MHGATGGDRVGCRPLRAAGARGARPIRSALLDSLAFSGLVAASVAGLLVALNARLLAPGLDAASTAPLVGLATAGAFVIYGLDRLRDVRGDRAAWPERSAFIDRNRRAMWVAVAIGAVIAAGCAAQQPPAVWAICAGVGGLGVAHRRLKTRRGFKIAYLWAAWCAVVVGLPAVHATEPMEPMRFAAIGLATAGALAANLIGSNASAGAAWTLFAARACAAAGVGCALGSGPNGAQALLLVPLAQLVALRWGVGDERARLWRIDGALAIGAALALGVLARH